LILGSGGTSNTARAVAESEKASDIKILSRKGEINYDNYKITAKDANVIINTTPVGMYPNCDATPINLDAFSSLEGVIDAVYNPLSTNLVLDAKARGIKACGGLFMLVAQAVVAVEKFLDKEFDEKVAQKVYSDILLEKENIVLTGMPGSGKSTVGKLIKLDGYQFFDTDAEIEKRVGCSIKELIEREGEKRFRDIESEVISEVSADSCRIIATGGGAILRDENIRALKKNGRIFFLDAPLSRLVASDDRPLSNTPEKLAKLYFSRIERYKTTADIIVPRVSSVGEEVNYILTKRTEKIQ
jgi:shikimate dehydrogenase